MAKKPTNNDEQHSDLKFGKQTLRIYPFPPGMHDLIMSQVIDANPLPEPPEVEIESFAGSEENPEIKLDFDNPDYKKEKARIEKLRDSEMASRILLYTLKKCCEVLNTKLMEEDIKDLGDILDFSDDPKERMQQYVKGYLLKTKDHYANVIQTAIAISIVDESEVADTIKSFPS